jgi:hypothetical protein
MIESDFEAFSAVVVGFAELKGKTLSTPAIKLYWGAMRHWSLEDFIVAAELLLQTAEFMPIPKDFEDLRKAGRATAPEAWITARDAIRSASWSDIESSGFTCGNPLIDRAVRAIGGYRAIGMCDSDKLHFLERRFAEHFETLETVTDTREAVPQITSQAGRLKGPHSVADLLPKEIPGTNSPRMRAHGLVTQ